MSHHALRGLRAVCRAAALLALALGAGHALAQTTTVPDRTAEPAAPEGSAAPAVTQPPTEPPADAAVPAGPSREPVVEPAASAALQPAAEPHVMPAPPQQAAPDTATHSAPGTATPNASDAATPTASPTATDTATPTASQTAPGTATPTASQTAPGTATPTASQTATQTEPPAAQQPVPVPSAAEAAPPAAPLSAPGVASTPTASHRPAQSATAHARAPAPGAHVAGPADTALLAARAAYLAGDADRVATYAPQVAGSLLEPYVAYWQAAARLRGPVPDDSAVQPFLARYAGTVLADRLRADWLMALATKGDFATFDIERRRLVLGGDDAQLACYTLLARYIVDDGRRREQIGREARRTLALTSDPGSDACTALAQRLMDDGVLSIWPRLQALVERNQTTAAFATAQRLPPADAAAVKAAVQNPAAWLAAADATLVQMAHPIPLLAIVALARDAPERAAYYADRLDATLTPEERGIVWGRIGRSGQLNLAPDAHAWYERGGDFVGVGPDYVRAPDVLETRVRADLRRGASGTAATAFAASGAASGVLPAPTISSPIDSDDGNAGTPAGPDWAAVRRDIARLSPEQQADTAWIYWNAHAAIALGETEVGRAGLQSIADRFSFYGCLAAEELGLPLRVPARAEDAPEAMVDQLSQRVGLQRARKLYELGLHEEGNREWNWELRGMDDASLHASAELARRIGVLDRMIASSERTRTLVDIAQRYPMPYRDFMTATAAPLGVDAAWIYGLIRQESRFMEDIRSNAGAVGLMQLMPATARFVAHRIGFDHYRADRIGDVNVNLRLGTEYLKLVSDDQDGQPMLASAAYNAGPNRVRRWRAALVRPLDGIIFAETIPIGETRDYVKKVLFNTVVYGTLLDHPAPSLHALLPAVVPKSVPATELP